MYKVNNETFKELKQARQYLDDNNLEDDITIVCDECGYEMDEDDTYYGLDGEQLCEDCFYDHYRYCDHCGEVVPEDETQRVNVGHGNTEYWCEYCRDDDAFWCDHCEEYYDNDHYDSYTTVDQDTVCECCRDDRYYTCNDCGYVVYDDDAYYDEDEDEYYCYHCWTENQHNHFSNRVAGYHCRPSMRYYYGTDNDHYHENEENFVGFGIELEVDTSSEQGHSRENEMLELLHGNLQDHTYYNRDGSLNYGFEIISQPHTREALMNLNWQQALTDLVHNGYRSHDLKTCGLHMHISRQLFGDDETTRTDNIAKMIMFYEVFWDDILRFSRRTEKQCDQWASRYIANETPTEDKCKDITSHSQGRYHAINLCNTNTIEFRLMRGTLKYNTFRATLDFLIQTALNSKNISWNDINNKDKWLQGMEQNTYDYMASRNCFGFTSLTTDNDNEEDDT